MAAFAALTIVLACLFHWVSGEAAAAADDNELVYLFTSFQEPARDGLRFLYSEDGYRWERIPGIFLKPWAGNGKLMRDPSLLRGPDGQFHLVWTSAWKGDPGFGYAKSSDLVHWSEQQFVPVMAHEPTCVNVWAPELFYDAPRNQFIICWASTIPGRYPDHLEEPTNNHRMYCTTTSDFKTFAPTQLFLEPGFSVIDGCIVQDGNRYLLVMKDNTRPQRNLRVAESDHPLGPWRNISEPWTKKFTEGPAAIKIGNQWMIYYDAYESKTYGAATTEDFKRFTDVTDRLSFPDGHKHGTVLRITRKELEYLQRVGSEQVPGVRLPWIPSMANAESDVQNPQHADLYGPASNKRVAENQSEPPHQAFLEDWLLRSCEIVDKYEPQIVYFDWWICQPVFQPY